jgi:hypothetical protein
LFMWECAGGVDFDSLSVSMLAYLHCAQFISFPSVSCRLTFIKSASEGSANNHPCCNRVISSYPLLWGPIPLDTLVRSKIELRSVLWTAGGLGYTQSHLKTNFFLTLGERVISLRFRGALSPLLRSAGRMSLHLETMEGHFMNVRDGRKTGM